MMENDGIARRMVLAGLGAFAPSAAFAQAPRGGGGPAPAELRNPVSASAAVRHHGVIIRTPDLDAALAFYGGGLGFSIADFWPLLGWARLGCNLPIYLDTAPDGRRQPTHAANAEITFQSNNLEASQLVLLGAGARVTTEAPYEVAVGRAIRFVDNAGIEHHMLQSNRSVPVFAEPKIYNTGFDVPEAAIAPTRGLLEQAFGFQPMTEHYFPPSVPYLEADHSFAFMLHHHQSHEPDWAMRENPRGDDLGVWQVFTTTDLRAAAAAANAHGAVSLDRRPRRFPMGRRMAFVTPGGGPFEIWSWA